MESFIKAFVACFALIDPVGNAPVFNASNNGKAMAYFGKTAVRSVIISIFLVLFLASEAAAP